MTTNTKTMSELKTMWKLSMGSLVQASVCTLTSGVVKAAEISAKSSDKLVAFVGEQAGKLYGACQHHLQKDSQVPGYQEQCESREIAAQDESWVPPPICAGARCPTGDDLPALNEPAYGRNRYLSYTKQRRKSTALVVNRVVLTSL